MSGRSWWSRRSVCDKILVIICLLLFVLAFCLAVVTIVTDQKLRWATEEASLMCDTKECIEAAADIWRNIDPSVQPCENFYDFACGNFMKTHAIPQDYNTISKKSIMQEDIYITIKKLIEPPVTSLDDEVTVKTKNLYASCMNSSGEDGSVDTLKKLLDRVGGWPVADNNWKKRDLNLERRLAILLVHGIKPFIDTYVRKDHKNITDFALIVSAGSLILTERFYLNDTNSEYIKYLDYYKQTIVATARLFDADEDTIQKDVADMIRFEKQYAKISEEDSIELRERWQSNQTEIDDERYSISDLEVFMPKIKWGSIFDYVFDFLKISVKKEDITVMLENEFYIRSLTFLVRKTSPRVMANYLTWRFIYKLMPYLDINFRRLYYDLQKTVPFRHYKEQQLHLSRWRECINIVSEIFQMPLTSLYVRENFGDVRKNKGHFIEVLALISSLKEGTIAGIHKQDWLDEKTKKACEEKIKKLKTKIGFPRYVLEAAKLAKDYSRLKVSPDRFLDNMLKINRHNVETEMYVLTGRQSRGADWIDEPLAVEAYFVPPLNRMTFPLAMLQPPMFIPRRPQFMNYGRLGVVIGHEIGHGFDTEGRLFSPDGEIEQWWEDEFVERYVDRAGCFAKQYFQLPIDMIGVNVNGNKTIDENIADCSGLSNAYRAYNMYVSENGEEPRPPGLPYTNSQLFFISYGQVWCELRTKEGFEKYLDDPHSPGRHRANVPLMNSPEFSAAFNCPLGSPMNPVKKCNLWG